MSIVQRPRPKPEPEHWGWSELKYKEVVKLEASRKMVASRSSDHNNITSCFFLESPYIAYHQAQRWIACCVCSMVPRISYGHGLSGALNVQASNSGLLLAQWLACRRPGH